VRRAPAYQRPANPCPGAPRWGAVKREPYWTKARCLEALREYLAELRPGQQPRVKHYQQLSTRRPWPALGRLQHHGRFQELIAEARELESPITDGTSPRLDPAP
jgi:hypothetical protein